MGTGDLCQVSPVPGAPSSGTLGESQAKFRDGRAGIVEGSFGYQAHGFRIMENSFCQETRGTRLRGSPIAMWLNVVLTLG